MSKKVDKVEETLENKEMKVENKTILEKPKKKMYIGPNVGSMFTTTIYEDIESGYIKQYRDKYPEIDFLLIDVDENTFEKKKQVKMKGNIYNAKYEELAIKLTKGGK